MKLDSRGQVTIPARLLAEHGLHEGDEVEVVDVDGVLQIVRCDAGTTDGSRLVEHLSGRATTGLTTDEIMGLLRAD